MSLTREPPNRAARRAMKHRSKAAAGLPPSRRLAFETYEPRILLSALLPVHGSIDAPGQTNQYSFTLNDAERVYFDSQTPSSQINWTLQGPTGTVVSARPFSNADSDLAPGQAALTLAAGDYTLTVAGRDATTGSYDFQILDLAGAAPIARGQQVDGQLAPGSQTDLYRFDGTAGESLFFDSHALDPQSTRWRVIGPGDAVVFDSLGLGQPSGPNRLTETGTYTVLIEGNVNQQTPVGYSFTVYDAVTNTAPLAPGAVAAGSLAAPGTTDAYDITLAQPTTLLFDSLTPRGDLRWTLTAPQGDIVSQRSFAASDGSAADPTLRLAAGSYRLSVSGVGAAAGAYAFRLIDIAAATPLALGAAQSGTLDDAGVGATVLHTEAGPPIGSGTPPAALSLGTAAVSAAIAPAAALQTQVMTVEAWVRRDFAASGAAVILQQGGGWSLGVAADGHLQFGVEGAVAKAATPLRLGAWTQVAGSYDGTTIRLYVDGAEVASQAFSGAVTYDGSGGRIGAADARGNGLWSGQLAEIRLWDTVRSAAEIAANRLAVLGPQAGLVGLWHLDEVAGLTLADSAGGGFDATLGPLPGTATQAFAVGLTAGQTYYLSVPDQQALAAGLSAGATVRLYDPAGGLVFSQALADRAGIRAEFSGTYTLVVEGNPGNATALGYTLRLVPSTTAQATLAVGDSVAGSIALPGQAIAYRFTLGGETRLLFDALAAADGLQWTLTGPRGVEVTALDLRASDGSRAPASPLLVLPAGDYVLTIAGAGAATGAFRFRLLDAGPAAAGLIPLALGGEATVTPDQATGTVLLRLDATAGDTITLNVPEGAFTATWVLFDPDGRVVLGPEAARGRTGIALGATGTYVLAIEAPIEAAAAPTLRIGAVLESHADPEALTGTPLGLGSIVAASFDAPGTTLDYVFTAAAGARLAFDTLLADSAYIVWRLDGPRGTEVADTPLFASDATEKGGSAVILLPQGGTYRLRFTNPGGYTGGFSFALRDLAQPDAVLATDGSTAQRTLTPANATEVLAFDAVAGTDLVLAASAAVPPWMPVDVRLVDPFGRQVLGPTPIGPMVLHIAATGRYTLLVEGQRTNSYYAGGADYAIALTPIADSAPVAIAAGQVVTGQIAAGGETDRYTLDLATDTRLVLGSFTSDPAVQFRILRADGAVVALRLSDAVGYGNGSPVFTLAAGHYTIAISASSDTAAPAYGFALYDVAAAEALTAGVGVDGTLAPNQAVAAYTIGLAAGEQLRLYTTREGAANDDEIVVLDPNGRALAPPARYFDSPATFQATIAGTYTILFEGITNGYGPRPGTSYTLTAYVDPPPATVPFGTLTLDTLANRFDIRRYSFTLDAAASIVFNSLAGDGNLSWTLTGPNGYSLQRNFYYSGSYEFGGGNPVLALEAGTYTLTFTTGSSAPGITYFQLLDLADAPLLAPGATVGGTDAPGNRTLLYAFDATAGQPVALNFTDPSNMLAMRVIDPNGVQLLGPVQPGLRLVTPTVTGRYTVMIEGRSWDGTPRDYGIGLATVPQPSVVLNGAGDLSSQGGPFSAPGQVGRALGFTGLETVQVTDSPVLDLPGSFTLEAWINPDAIDAGSVPILTRAGGRDYAYALGLTNGDQVWLKFSDADGSYATYTTYGVAPIGSWTHVAGVVDVAAGVMTIYINGVVAAQQGFGGYVPVASRAPLVIGADQALGRFNDGAFQGLIQQVSVWNIARGADDILAGMNSALTGAESGLVAYLPLADASGSTTIAERGPNGLTASVARIYQGLDNVISGRIEQPFETVTYRFTLDAATRFVIDGLTDDDAFSVTLTGPDGLSVTRGIRRADSYEFRDNPVFAAGPGDYTLVVSAANGHVGGYGFRLLDLAAAAPVALDTPISFTLPAGFATQALRFTGQAGDRIVLRSLSLPVNTDLVTLRLIDPLGRQVAGPVDFASLDSLATLPLDGEYVLLVEGRTYYDRYGAFPVSLELDRAATTPATLTIGAPNPNAGPSWGAGIVPGQGLVLTGADEVRVPDGAAVDQTGSFSIEAMVNIARFNGYTPIATKVASTGSSGGGGRAYGLYVNADGSIVATERDSFGEIVVSSAAGVVQAGQWAALALVVDRTFGTMSVLLNGVVVGTTGIRTEPGVVKDGALVIGGTDEADSGYGRMEGALGWLRMWSVALTPEQVAANLAATPAADTAGLVLDLPFAEGSGRVTANIAPGGGSADLVSSNTDGVTGVITRGGQGVAYSFTLAETRLISVDSLNGNSGLGWSITGPYGVVAGNRLTATNGYDVGGNPVLTLQAGTYVFTVGSANGGTGAYNMRLVDLGAQAIPFVPGTAVSGVMDQASRSVAYSFTASLGDSFYFTPLQVSGEVSWRLIDPTGRQVVGPTGFNPQGVTLGAGGTWTILLEGRAAQGGRSTFSFNAALTPVVTRTLTLGETVSASIDIPSQQDVYRFSVAGPTQVVFDSLTNDGSMLWSLAGPTGALRTDEAFSGTDGDTRGGGTLLTLVPGDYVLTVRGDHGHAGAYAFRLLDAAAGTSLALGAPVSGTLGDQGRATAVYRLEATARERVVFAATDSSNPSTTWRLLDPYGNLVFGPAGLGNSGPVTLVAGTYTLLVEGTVRAGEDATYGFSVSALPQQDAAGQTTQDFDTAGLLPYTPASFAGAVPTLVAGATGNALQLTSGGDGGPQDGAIYFPATQDGPLASITIDLDLTITPSAPDNRNSSIMVALLDAARWGNSGLGPDLYTNAGLAGSLGIAFDVSDRFGGDGAHNHVAIVGGGGLIAQQLVSPANADLGAGTPVHATITVTQADGGARVTVVLTPQGGAAFTAVDDLFVGGYVLNPLRVAIAGQSYFAAATQTVDNVAIQAVPGADPATPIALGEVVSGAITLPNAVERYAFDLAQATTIVFDNLTVDPGSINYGISGPQGGIVGDRLYASDWANRPGGNALRLGPGHYVVTLSADFQRTGAYSFRLLDTAAATPIRIGQVTDAPVTASFADANQTRLFSFDATAGQKVAFYNTGPQPFAFWRIIDPDGQLVAGPTYIGSFAGALTLAKTGSYLLEIEGYYGHTGPTSVEFRLLDVGDRVAPLTLGETFSGGVPQPGQRDIHAFTLTGTTLVYVDALDGNGNATWQLVGPTGQVDSRNFRNTDGITRGETDKVALALGPGSYQFIVTYNDVNTGSYAFRLLDLGAATALAAGTAVPIALDPANGTQAYGIAATAGERLHVSVTGGSNVSLRLVDPPGASSPMCATRTRASPRPRWGWTAPTPCSSRAMSMPAAARRA